MRDQLPNPIRFIIDYISSWCGIKIASPSRTLLYQKYLEWCGENGEKPFSNNIIRRNFQILVLRANKREQVAEKGNGNYT